MLKIIKKISPCEILVEKVFSSEEITKLEKKILIDKSKTTILPGFRLGNVPLEQIREKMIAADQWTEEFEMALQKKFLLDWNEKPVNKEKFGDIIKIKKINFTTENPLTMELNCEFFPNVPIDSVKYSSLSIKNKQTVDQMTASPKEVTETLKDLQKRRSITKPDKTVEIPEINDEFARSLGNFKDLGELKKKLQEGIKLEKIYQEKEKRRDEFINLLITEFDLAVPPSLLESKPAEKENVVKRVKLQKIIEAIALKENIFPSEEEIKREMEIALRQFGSPQAVKKVFPSLESLQEEIIYSLIFQETLRFLEKENKLLDDLDAEIKKIEKKI